jgi:hypothetical protein
VRIVGDGDVRICTIEQSDFKTQYGSELNEMRIEGYSCQGGKGVRMERMEWEK